MSARMLRMLRKYRSYRRRPAPNMALVATRTHMSAGPWAHVLATCLPPDGAALDPYDMAAVFPLYVRPAPPPEGQRELGL